MFFINTLLQSLPSGVFMNTLLQRSTCSSQLFSVQANPFNALEVPAGDWHWSENSCMPVYKGM